MTQAKHNLCQLLVLAAVVAVVAADILPTYRPVGPRGPHHHHHHPNHPNQKLIKRPFRPPPRPQQHPHFRPQPVHLGRAPPRPHKFAPASPPPRIKYTHAPAPAKHFSPSPPAQSSHYIPPVMSEGAIHTIPAPNLGPSSGRVPPPPALVSSVASPVLPFNHFDFKDNYKVREDPTKGHGFGAPFYAPDPDPSRPAPKVPITRDPLSHPSKGAVSYGSHLDHYSQHNQHQQFEASVPQPSKVAPPHLLTQQQLATFTADPNSRFLQAFQDQYQRYEPHHQVSVSDEDKEKNDIDYDSGAEVRYSFAPAPSDHDQEDAASEFLDDEDDEEILEDSGASFGDKLRPKRVKKD